MADAPATKPAGRMGFLSRKLGPIPVWGWGLIGFGVYYWYTHYGPGAKSAKPAAPAAPRPQIVVVNPREAPEPGRPPPRKGGRRPPQRRDRDRRRPATAAAAGAPVPGSEPGQVTTPQAPVYDQWTADAGGVPDPGQAYAPMTAGSIYG